MNRPLKKPETSPSPEEENASLKVRIAELQHQLDWFKRQLFGSKSERFIPDPGAAQQDDLFAAPEDKETPEKSTKVAGHTRLSSRKKRGDEVNDKGLRFDKDVPRQIIDIKAPELRGERADDYEIIDYKETTRLAQQPGSYIILTYRRPVVRHKKDQSLTTAPAPDNVLEGCYADVSLLSGLMVDKAVYHLPLYRQHQRMEDSGIRVSRGTLTNWMQKAADLLEPIYKTQRAHILKSTVLAMDEVPIKAGRKARGKMRNTYYWPMYGEEDEVAFTWSQGRKKEHAINELRDFTGSLLTDGYAAYEATVAALNTEETRIIHAVCWAHSRRTFEKALKMEPEAAEQALAFIARLYQVEKHIRTENKSDDPAKHLDQEQILAYRRDYSEPVVKEFFDWVYQQRQRPDLLPSNPLSKALLYVHNRVNALKVFLSNPNMPIDTNHLERALRVIPMGRKNYLFCWSELGAKQLGIIQSLMVTCRLQGVNPYNYLVDVLQRISTHPATEIDQLTPRLWKKQFKGKILTSDINNNT
tara:strand:+ start:871 stop:2454 length:1584 start_codon:yes stop_codon:yes gene_type:complete